MYGNSTVVTLLFLNRYNLFLSATFLKRYERDLWARIQSAAQKSQKESAAQTGRRHAASGLKQTQNIQWLYMGCWDTARSLSDISSQSVWAQTLLGKNMATTHFLKYFLLHAIHSADFLQPISTYSISYNLGHLGIQVNNNNNNNNNLYFPFLTVQIGSSIAV